MYLYFQWYTYVLCEPSVMSAILLFTPRNSVCLGLNIEKQSHTFQLSLFFFYTLGSALVKCGETEKKIGQAGRELKAKSMTNFLHQLKTFLEGDMKTIAVSTLTFYICTVAGADLGGGCRGCAPPPPQDDLRFSNTTGILPKKKLCGLLVLK